MSNLSSKDKLLVFLYRDMEANKGNYEKICQLISEYVGKMLGHRTDWDAHEEALELYEDLKQAAVNAGYIDRITRSFD